MCCCSVWFRVLTNVIHPHRVAFQLARDFHQSSLWVSYWCFSFACRFITYPSTIKYAFFRFIICCCTLLRFSNRNLFVVVVIKGNRSISIDIYVCTYNNRPTLNKAMQFFPIKSETGYDLLWVIVPRPTDRPTARAPEPDYRTALLWDSVSHYWILAVTKTMQFYRRDSFVYSNRPVFHTTV